MALLEITFERELHCDLLQQLTLTGNPEALRYLSLAAQSGYPTAITILAKIDEGKLVIVPEENVATSRNS